MCETGKVQQPRGSFCWVPPPIPLTTVPGAKPALLHHSKSSAGTYGKMVDGAKKYEFELTSPGASKAYVFQSKAPYDPLPPVWATLPVGSYTLKVSALTGDGKKIGLAGERDFYRAAPLNNAIYPAKVMMNFQHRLESDQ